MKDFPKCKDDAIDCFASWCVTKDGCTCKILTEGIVNCPFYKSKQQYAEELRKERLAHEKGKYGVYY